MINALIKTMKDKLGNVISKLFGAKGYYITHEEQEYIKNDILVLKEALENYNQEIEETLFK